MAKSKLIILTLFSSIVLYVNAIDAKVKKKGELWTVTEPSVFLGYEYERAPQKTFF